MTCSHVLGLIDAGPFADYPRAHLDAAWEHARHCATCGSALAASETLTRALKALPQLTASRDMTGGVLARIAAVEMPLPVHVTVRAAARADEAGGDSWEWASHAAAIAATVAAAALLSSGAIPIPESASGDGLMGTLIDVPPIASGTLALAACLALYGFGLFAAGAAGRDRGSL
jgi:hypothetical protein